MKMLTNKHTRTMFCAVLSCIALFVIISVILMSLRADDAASDGLDRRIHFDPVKNI